MTVIRAQALVPTPPTVRVSMPRPDFLTLDGAETVLSIQEAIDLREYLTAAIQAATKLEGN